jgi:hypothetical protein
MQFYKNLHLIAIQKNVVLVFKVAYMALHRYNFITNIF